MILQCKLVQITTFSAQDTSAHAHMHRYGLGTCAPYSGQFELCNNYINSSSYVYTLSTNQPSVEQFDTLDLIIGEDNCRDMTMRIICNYFFAPCGSVDGVHRPISLCQDECEFVTNNCSALWDRLQRQMSSFPERIFCNDTLSRFGGLSTCCSGFGIVIPTPPPGTYTINLTTAA